MDDSARPLTVIPVSAFQDNYVWLLCRGDDAVVVDPGDAEPVERALEERHLALRAILLTHHHADHVGGVLPLLATRAAQVHEAIEVYGPAGEAIAGVTDPLREGDRVDLESIGLSFDVLDVPGHTRGHIAYVSRVNADTAADADAADDDANVAPMLFCGDTLFAAGCGRLFEGTAAQMHASLSKLAALPARTEVYCAHEYTLANLRFAQAVEPDSPAVAARIVSATATREAGRPTLPSTIALERATNPFLRVSQRPVRDAVDRHQPAAAETPLATFTALRKWKDAFR